jgi:DNA-binding winged helix-turn-helix (wHTH) protein
MQRAHDWELPSQSKALGPANGNANGAAEPIARLVADDDGDGALELLEPHIHALAEAGMRPVFLLDDFANEYAFGALSADQTGRLATWMPYCAFIFATERLLEKVNPNARKGSPLFMRLPQTFIREYEREEAHRFLAEALKDNKAGFPSEDVEFLLDMAGGFPYLLLLGGRALWDMRRRMGWSTEPGARNPLSPGRRAILYPRLGTDFSRSFATYLRVLDAGQQADLIDLANLRPGETVKLSGDMTSRENRLSLLEQYGLVDVQPDLRVQLFSPLFGDYLRTQRLAAADTRQPALTELQANLYDVFRNRPDEVLTFAELGQKVWDWPLERRREVDPEDKRKIHIAISKLRRQLEESDTGERIVSLRSRGYRFEPSK